MDRRYQALSYMGDDLTITLSHIVHEVFFQHANSVRKHRGNILVAIFGRLPPQGEILAEYYKLGRTRPKRSRIQEDSDTGSHSGMPERREDSKRYVDLHHILKHPLSTECTM